MATRFELKPDKLLLNPNFESYKLSLEPLPTYNQDLEKGELDFIRPMCIFVMLQIYALIFGASVPNHGVTADTLDARSSL
jgi:hypothetical protein